MYTHILTYIYIYHIYTIIHTYEHISIYIHILTYIFNVGIMNHQTSFFFCTNNVFFFFPEMVMVPKYLYSVYFYLNNQWWQDSTGQRTQQLQNGKKNNQWDQVTIKYERDSQPTSRNNGRLTINYLYHWITRIADMAKDFTRHFIVPRVVWFLTSKHIMNVYPRYAWNYKSSKLVREWIKDG